MFLYILVADFTDMEENNAAKSKSVSSSPPDAPARPPRERKPASKKAKEDAATAPKFWNDGRLSKITGLVLMLLAFVMAVAFTSYMFNAAVDQSEVAGSNTSLNGAEGAANAFGTLGAKLAHGMIHGMFGLAAYLFVWMSFAAGFNLLVQKNVFNILKIFIYCFFGIVWLSVALAFANMLILPDSIISWGGAFGDFLAGERGYLTKLVKPLGVGALLVVSALIGAVAVYNISFSFLTGWGKNLKNHAGTNGETTVSATQTENAVQTEIREFRDESENIFAKDNIETSPAAALRTDTVELEVTSNAEAVIISAPQTQETPVMTTEEVKLEIQETAEQETLSHNTGAVDTVYDPTLELSQYEYPTLDLLEEYGSDRVKIDPEELERNKTQIVTTLNNYQIEISKIKATIGPTVTLYEIVPAAGVRISRIKNLEDDIALSLAALGIRIIAPIPGKGTIGIEVPNAHKEVVSMRSLLASEKFQNSTADLPICLGKSISNEIYVADLAKMPHLLMAGATGQGKSVGINSILVSLLYKKHPSQLKFVLVDPKKVELSLYEALEKHFLAKLPGEEDAIITDTKKVVTTLNALCLEMDDRYNLLKKAACRNIKEYNHKFINRQLNPRNGHKYLPYIVLVIDEFADLIMTAGKEVETPIARLAQLARAIGIHLILATQRPSVNIITGTIKANFPARIAFKTTSKVDSRTILDQGGAEQLIGRGDMLLSIGSDIIRLQCGFVDTPEVERVRDYIAAQQGYTAAFELPEYIDPNAKGDDDFFIDGERDEMFEEAARLIVQNQMGSTSLIQRRLKLGYNRAGRLMDQLQEAGIVGENIGTKAREVKFKTEAELEQYLQKLREQTAQ
ncbi:MAG: DNA translocase FtsK [Chitinophagales bacterium]|nr:DNA translocase FtsK [Chitinophagales bacterium]MDW8418990.1 DNA translocase FtsK 4TM domain-containing protein [Chitinophagales bacterium]